MVEQTEEFTNDEAALYDRQIRLWGLDAQRRLRSCKVLVVGLRGLGAEICKNIILAGIKSLTILESSTASTEDTCAQFFIDEKDMGKNLAESALAKLKQLNPMVEISTDAEDVESKSAEYLSQFDVVILTGCSRSVAIHVNRLCRQSNIQFFAGDVAGLFGYTFSDLGRHEYADEIAQVATTGSIGSPPAKKPRSDGVDTKVVKKTMTFSSLENALEQDKVLAKDKKKSKRLSTTYFVMQVLHRFQEEVGRRPSLMFRQADTDLLNKIRNEMIEELSLDSDPIDGSFVRYCFAELSPVCTIVGGVLAQEVIKAVSHKDQPLKNFFFYNGLSLDGGLVESIGHV